MKQNPHAINAIIAQADELLASAPDPIKMTIAKIAVVISSTTLRLFVCQKKLDFFSENNLRKSG